MAHAVVWCVLAAVLVIGTTQARPLDDANKSTGSLGSPFFDEIVVESTLTVRGKGGASRQSRGKKLQVVPAEREKKLEVVPVEGSKKSTDEADTLQVVPSEGASIQLTRPKRQQRNGPPRHHGHGNQQNRNNFGGPQQFRGQNQNFGRPNFGGQGFPSGSASSANAAAQGFNVAGPNGFGASATNAGTQGFQFGPNGFQGTAAQSASQTYRLPNGNSINVAFSNGFNVGPNGASQSGANSVSVTGANGQKQQLFG